MQNFSLGAFGGGLGITVHWGCQGGASYLWKYAAVAHFRMFSACCKVIHGPLQDKTSEQS